MAYTIQKGDTLSQLAQKHGTTVAELMKLNPQIKDPNKIYAGEGLTLPQATAIPDTTVPTLQMGGDTTLPPIGDTLPGLPTMDITNVQNEDVLAMALKNIAQLAQREGKVTGAAAASQFFADRGILPEDLPGSSVVNMLAVVDRAMTSPVAERAESLADLINITSQSKQQLQNTAATQIDFLIGGGMWNDMEPELRQNLWETAGLPGVAQRVKTSTLETAYDEWIEAGAEGSFGDWLMRQDVEGLIVQTPEGDLINLGSVEGLRIAKSRGYFDSYADAYAWLDKNSKLTVNAIKNLLEEAGYAKKDTTLNYSILVWTEEARKMLTNKDAQKMSPEMLAERFLRGLEKHYTNMTELDKEVARETIIREQQTVQELGTLARRAYLKEYK